MPNVIHNWLVEWEFTLQSNYGYEQCFGVGPQIILPAWGFFNVDQNLSTQRPRLSISHGELHV